MTPQPDNSRRDRADVINQRRRGRFRTDLLDCELGMVLDLSAEGMRVLHRGRCRHQVGDYLELTLRQFDIEVPVNARIVWLKETGRRKYEIGFVFTGVDAEGHEAIAHIAQVSVACYSHNYNLFNRRDDD